MSANKIKVLVVDDSPFARQSISMMISGTPHVEVIGTVSGGLEAMRFLEKEKPDIITLDIEMPEMNGFTFLRWLMQNNPLPVMVISSKGDSQNVFKALELGALEFISKPTPKASLELLNLKDELIRKIEIISKIPRNKIEKQVTIYSSPPPSRQETRKAPLHARNVQIVVIGASTGGPAAIQLIVSSLPSNIRVPVVIVQHMPPNFTRSFAQRLDSLSKLRVKEVGEGDRILPGRIYVAPGGCHLIARSIQDGNAFNLAPKGAGDRFTPSIDKTMVSIAELYGEGTLGIILTGMGNDGTEGIKKIKELGGIALAESEETAVVYGMPRIPVQLGIIDQIFPVTQMADQIIRLTATGTKS